jgi:YidC/Oxa1 family membrane protein insertase
MLLFGRDKVLRAEERKFKPEASVFNYISWSAYDDNYFATIVLPETATGSAAFLRFENGKSPYFFLAASAPRTVFAGPKEISVLKALGSDTRKVVRYGMFGLSPRSCSFPSRRFTRRFPTGASPSSS